MTDDEFDQILKSDGVPWARLAGAGRERAVVVPALIAYVGAQGFDVDEQQLDEQVRRHGGHKETEVWDVGDVPRNLLRFLVRRARRRSSAIYIIP